MVTKSGSERGERRRREEVDVEISGCGESDGREKRPMEESGERRRGCRRSVDGERKEKESDGGEGRIGAKKRLIKKFFLNIIVRSCCGPRVYVLFDETDG